MNFDSLFEAITSGMILAEVKTSMIRSGAIQKRSRLAGRETVFMAKKSDQMDYKKYQFYRQQLNIVKDRMRKKLGSRAKIKARQVLR
jgi:hypothetical protein